MFTHFAGLATFSAIIYLVVLVFALWLAYRFVKAHEQIAESLRKMESSSNNEFRQ